MLDARRAQRQVLVAEERLEQAVQGASARGPRARRRPASARTAGPSRAATSPPRLRAAVAARRPVPHEARDVAVGLRRLDQVAAVQAPVALVVVEGAFELVLRLSVSATSGASSGGPPRDHSASAAPQLRVASARRERDVVASAALSTSSQHRRTSLWSMRQPPSLETATRWTPFSPTNSGSFNGPAARRAAADLAVLTTRVVGADLDVDAKGHARA